MGAIKKIGSIVLRIAISVVLLVFLFKFNHIDVHDVFGMIKSADKPLLAAAFFVFLLTYVVGFIRWYMLLWSAGIRLPVGRVIVSFSGGNFFSLFLPSTIGGDLTRSIDLGAHTKKPREIVATVFVDRLSGFVGLTLVALASLCLGWGFVKGYMFVLVAIGVITGLLAVLLLVLFNRFLYDKINTYLSAPDAGRIREILQSLHHEIHIFRERTGIIIPNVLCSVIIQIIIPLSSFLIAYAMGVRINFTYFLIFLPIIGAVSMLPVSIGGLGLRENSTVLLFAHAGMDRHLALGMSLLNFFFMVASSAIGGLIYVFGIRYRRLQRH